MDEELHDHDTGSSHDLPTLLDRRRALQLLGGAGLGAGLLVVAGCSSSASGGAATATTVAPTATTAGSSGSATTTESTQTASCAPLPEETAGPYPGDGTNGPTF